MFALRSGSITIMVSSVCYLLIIVVYNIIHPKGPKSETTKVLLKDYDVTVQYHPCKANVVADACMQPKDGDHG